jgi:hypothetical protein
MPPVRAVTTTKYPTGSHPPVKAENVAGEPTSQEIKKPSTHPVRTR